MTASGADVTLPCCPLIWLQVVHWSGYRLFIDLVTGCPLIWSIDCLIVGFNVTVPVAALYGKNIYKQVHVAGFNPDSHEEPLAGPWAKSCSPLLSHTVYPLVNGCLGRRNVLFTSTPPLFAFYSTPPSFPCVRLHSFRHQLTFVTDISVY